MADNDTQNKQSNETQGYVNKDPNRFGQGTSGSGQPEQSGQPGTDQGQSGQSGGQGAASAPAREQSSGMDRRDSESDGGTANASNASWRPGDPDIGQPENEQTTQEPGNTGRNT